MVKTEDVTHFEIWDGEEELGGEKIFEFDAVGSDSVRLTSNRGSTFSEVTDKTPLVKFVLGPNMQRCTVSENKDGVKDVKPIEKKLKVAPPVELDELGNKVAAKETAEEVPSVASKK